MSSQCVGNCVSRNIKCSYCEEEYYKPAQEYYDTRMLAKRKAPDYFKQQGPRSSQVNSMYRTFNSAKRRKAVSGPLATPAVQGMIPRRGYANKEEVKSVDTSSISMIFSTTAQFTVVNIPIQGAAFYNRIGTRIGMKSLNIRGWIQPSATNTAASAWDFGRWILIYDRQPGSAGTGAFPAIASLLLEYNSAGATNTSAWSGVNQILKDRFTIIRDKNFGLPPLGVSAVAPAQNPADAFFPDPREKNSFMINEHIKLAGLEAHYNQTNGGTIGDIATGALYIVTLAQTSTAAQGAWAFLGTARLRYTDA